MTPRECIAALIVLALYALVADALITNVVPPQGVVIAGAVRG
ncbi:hypothetical protein [Sphingobium lignivorans]|uniref:Uncharacterized protein n=1 Tax=Sphingobium lignivorans TaxID=2735886 RepID=A0ABR6NH74_9SPHN|nr:hypothetical protein [Sphingobium lignivorans]MBB5985987.1 hypothetical protein [Sphingobium lignivorans]